MADTPMPDPVPDAPPAVEGEEEEDLLSGSEEEEEGEEEEDGAGDSDDECEDFDDSKQPEDQLLDYSFSAIKVVNCDFLGDFGAAEVFMIDGDALIARALVDRLLDTTCGGQMLHLVHTVEAILQGLKQRGAHFELFFFEGNRTLWQKMGTRARAARAVVLRHFQLVNKQRELQGQPAAVRIHLLPGGWWSGGPEFQAMVDQVGPAYMMTDFGWCGAEDKVVLSITRSLVHFLHANFIQVVTICDISIEGSRTFANNMQPARKPTTRAKFAQAMAKLVSNNKAALDAPVSSGAAGAVGAGDAAEATFSAALKIVAASKAGGEKTDALASALALSAALSKHVPLTERAFVITDAALSAWKAGAAGWATAADEFMQAMNAAVATVLDDDSNATALLGAVTKDGSIRLADVVDGRLFLVVLARCLAGGMKLSPEISAAAQKMFAAANGKKPAGAAGGDEKASDELIKSIQKEAQDRKAAETPKPVLLPMDGKELLQAVQVDIAGKMVKYEDNTFDHAKHTLGKYRDKRYKDVEPFGDEPDPFSYKVGADIVIMKKATKWNNAARQAQLKARFGSGYIDSLLLGQPVKRQVIAQLMPDEERERRKVQGKACLEEEAEQARRAAKKGGGAAAQSSDSAKPDKKDKKEKKGGGGKGQQGSGKADAIRAEAEAKRLADKMQNKRSNLEHVIKNAPKDLKMEMDALIKHLEELRVCAQKCNDDGAGPIAVEAELVALRHILDACKRDKKETLIMPRHVKRGFVVLPHVDHVQAAHCRRQG